MLDFADFYGLCETFDYLDPSEQNQVSGYPHRIWRDKTGKLLIEDYRVTGMGHGTPLSTSGECGCGRGGAFMLEAGISSTVESAKTWGLLNEPRKKAPLVADDTLIEGLSDTTPKSSNGSEAGRTEYITRVIQDALRTAGLRSRPA